MNIPSRSAMSMRQLAAVALCLLLVVSTTVHAGMRGTGKYSGVVIFDRWDTCFLLSGPYMTYISEAVKEQLRPYAGQAIQIDVTELTQPMNPGDALVKSYAILGEAPDDPSDPLADIEIAAEPAFDGESAPMFDITVSNISLKRVSVSPSEVGLTLLGINQKVFFSASDGKSVAWITRANLDPQGPDQTVGSSWSSTEDGKMVAYAKYNAAQPCAFKNRIQLAVDESVSCRVRLDIPTGEYQFMAGYGGGVHAWKSIASNAISFNVDATGVATVEP